MEPEVTVQAAVQEMYKAVSARANCRGLLAMLAAQLGALPQVRDMVRSFPDVKKYPERPMLTLFDGQPSVYLLGWREGEFTDIHDHGACEVGIYVMQGVVTEDLYVATSKVIKEGDTCDCVLSMSRFLKQGDMATCPEQYIHRVGNVFPEPAATLHVYGPALEKMKIFEMVSGVLKFASCWGCNDVGAPH